MQVIHKKTKFSYENRISYAQRVRIVKFYHLGYAIAAIARSSGISSTAVLHHLRSQGAYDPNHKVTRWKEEIPRKVVFTKYYLRVPSNPYLDMPEHIQAIYKKMHEEQNEMAQRRAPRKKRKGYVAHKHILADRADKWDKVPFKAAITIEL